MRRAVKRLHRHHVQANRIRNCASQRFSHSLRLDVLSQPQLVVVPLSFELIEEGVRDAAAFAVNLIDYWRSLLVSVNDQQFAALGFHYGGCANLRARPALSGEGEIRMMVFVIQLHAALLFDAGGLRCCQVFVLFGD